MIGFAVGAVDAIWFDLAGAIALSALLVYGLTHQRARPVDPRPTWTWTKIVLLAAATFAVILLIVFVDSPWLDRFWSAVGAASLLGFVILFRRGARSEPQ
jgi:hypothetical protein